jgi:hypothetical protein
MFKFLNITRKFVKEIKKNKRLIESDLYYKDLNDIPLLNWWHCYQGDLTYLWKKKKSDIPDFFKLVFNEMRYQFDFIDLEGTRKLVEYNKYMNKYLLTKDIKWKRKADTSAKKAELLNETNEEYNTKLNDLIRFVQTTLNLNYYPDARTMSAGYFFNLYNEAKKIVEKNVNN